MNPIWFEYVLGVISNFFLKYFLLQILEYGKRREQHRKEK